MARQKSRRSNSIDSNHIEEALSWRNGSDVDKPLKISSPKGEIVPKNKKQEELIEKIYNDTVIFVHGPAGTGKTFMALKAAIDLLRKNLIKKILITKPAIEAQEKIGFLPGTLEEKLSPYLSSYEQNLSKIIGKESLKALKEKKIIDSLPIAYMRGMTFDNTLVLLDECQNLTVDGLKLVLSRLGENSKMVVMGDIDQTDLKFKYNESNGLEDAFERFTGLDNVSFVEFTEDEIVRNPILIEIMKRYSF